MQKFQRSGNYLEELLAYTVVKDFGNTPSICLPIQLSYLQVTFPSFINSWIISVLLEYFFIILKICFHLEYVFWTQPSKPSVIFLTML